MGAALVVAPLAQASYFGTAEDPRGDALDPNPGRDLAAASLFYDRRAGTLTGAVRFHGPPEQAPSFVTLVAGLRTATGCDGYPALGFGSLSDAFSARWLRMNDSSGAGPRGSADKRGGGDAVQQFSVTDRQLAGMRPNCAIATVTDPDNSAIVYDTTGPIALAAQPELAVGLSRVPDVLVASRPRRITVTVRNVGDAATGLVRVRFGLVRGLRTVPRAVTLRSIAPGARRVTNVRVTLSPRSSLRTPLKVRATAGKIEARVEATLHRRQITRPSTGGSSGSGNRGSQLCTRFQPDLSGQTGGSLVLVPC
ncbi:MAG: hypothetical protein Q8O56_02400 [Solirubrobacteraceae bacterium]|nr:hypothetical protein [Solirubrobacteraceae bacterium]